MPRFARPIPIILNGVRRLRLVADAIEAGQPLTDVSIRFRVSLGALRQILLPKSDGKVEGRGPSEVAIKRSLELYQAGIKLHHIQQETGIAPSRLYKYIHEAKIALGTKRKTRGGNVKSISRRSSAPIIPFDG
jgi:hypothetical protein